MNREPNQTVLWIIVAGLAAWGLFLALGAYLGGPLHSDPRRGLMVLACMGAFLGFWLLMLRTRRTRPK